MSDEPAEYREVTAAEIDAVLGDVLPAPLRAAGFENVGSIRRWVRARAPLRDVFELRKFKGIRMGPIWGVSLDFVPHVQGDSVRFHRTNKSAVIDVQFAPLDFFDDIGNWSLERFRGEETLRRDALRVLPHAVSRALEWLNSFREEDLLERVEHHRTARRAYGGLKFENITQQPLARAFLLARAGRLEEAREALGASWVSSLASEQVQRRLHALLKECLPA